MEHRGGDGMRESVPARPAGTPRRAGAVASGPRFHAHRHPRAARHASTVSGRSRTVRGRRGAPLSPRALPGPAHRTPAPVPRRRPSPPPSARTRWQRVRTGSTPAPPGIALHCSVCGKHDKDITSTKVRSVPTPVVLILYNTQDCLSGFSLKGLRSEVTSTARGNGRLSWARSAGAALSNVKLSSLRVLRDTLVCVCVRPLWSTLLCVISFPRSFHGL